MLKHSADRSRKAVRDIRGEGHTPHLRHRWKYLCGTLYEMPTELTIDEIVAEANRAVLFAQSVRKAHARRTKRGGQQREVDIRIALAGLQTAMKPLRRKIARLPYLAPGTPAEGLYWASDAIQKERRKLWKMKSRKTRTNKSMKGPT